ncbi:UDP-diphosphatase [Porphyromonas macacae]|uniref:Undecaprenyl-diphosphatase n=1 Tax=Porphyromonas macacae TaxID=28115 RepID=A0A0A2EFR6_9PORP|nr:undecaprenyl-diphosphatase UppP [Porphyromonas macacae]KGN76310.1 UDP-diphosphatase [Porphyromonas macacae]SUB89483.1 Undecaprenyl-diphosphatase [Porphyromonas macacae]
MTLLESVILAVVEGLTEFLPVSSTGHMILTEGLLGMESTPYLRAFIVMIQFGAILSVVVLYWKRFFNFRKPSAGERDSRYAGLTGWNLYLLMIIGLIPAAVMGLLFESYIDRLLGSMWVTVAMLFVGGVFMLFMDTFFIQEKKPVVTPKKALIVGFFQCIAMIPGVSRSMATIVGGMQQRLTRKQAAEFSFFLAVPTMFGATVLKGYKLYKEFGIQIFYDNMLTLITGNVVAFIVAMFAIKFFIGYVTRKGFKIFGYYRIVISLLFMMLLLTGVVTA